jgi:hypothetical protein
MSIYLGRLSLSTILDSIYRNRKKPEEDVKSLLATEMEIKDNVSRFLT